MKSRPTIIDVAKAAGYSRDVVADPSDQRGEMTRAGHSGGRGHMGIVHLSEAPHNPEITLFATDLRISSST